MLRLAVVFLSLISTNLYVNCQGAVGGWRLLSHSSSRAYLLLPTPLTWTEAEDTCQSLYGHLARDDPDGVLREYIQSLGLRGQVWVGLHQPLPQEPFRWVDDFSWLSGWVSREPGLDVGQQQHEYRKSLCVSLNVDQDFRWDTRYCENEKVASSVCQIEVPRWLRGALECSLGRSWRTSSTSLLYYPDNETLVCHCDDSTSHTVCTIQTSDERPVDSCCFYKNEDKDVDIIFEEIFKPVGARGGGEKSESSSMNHNSITESSSRSQPPHSKRTDSTASGSMLQRSSATTASISTATEAPSAGLPQATLEIEEIAEDGGSAKIDAGGKESSRIVKLGIADIASLTMGRKPGKNGTDGAENPPNAAAGKAYDAEGALDNRVEVDVRWEEVVPEVEDEDYLRFSRESFTTKAQKVVSTSTPMSSPTTSELTDASSQLLPVQLTEVGHNLTEAETATAVHQSSAAAGRPDAAPGPRGATEGIQLSELVEMERNNETLATEIQVQTALSQAGAKSTSTSANSVDQDSNGDKDDLSLRSTNTWNGEPPAETTSPSPEPDGMASSSTANPSKEFEVTARNPSTESSSMPNILLNRNRRDTRHKKSRITDMRSKIHPSQSQEH